MMKPARALITAISGSCTLAALIPATYLGVLTVAAARSGRGERTSPGDRSPAEHSTRFVVYVPAHNEETIIAATVRALQAQRYPRDRFSVHVVADNCTDSTATIAAAAGAVAHVRDEPNDPGKGPALNWLHDRLAGDDAEVVVIIDADTVAEPGFLAAMDVAFGDGAVAAQGYYGVSDPGSGSAVALRYAALACRHHLRPLGRTALGGSCGLFGNGMAFRSELLTRHRWSGHLVEDAEFQMELLFDGVLVAYVPAARLAAEMPDSLAGARTQNERWELGRAQLTRIYVPRLVRTARSGGRLPRQVYLDGAADHLLPPMSALAALDGIAVVVGGLAALAQPTRVTRFAWWGAIAASIVMVAHVLCALRLVRAPSSVYWSLASAPRLIIWKLGLLKSVVRRPDQVSWIRTARNSEQSVVTLNPTSSDE